MDGVQQSPAKWRGAGRRLGNLAATVILLMMAAAIDGRIAGLGANSDLAQPAQQARVTITTEAFDPASFPLEAFGD
ncbi:MAG: hypothetical protein ACR2O4_04680 [Hyphomicrobiaceae bacterium]